MSQPTPYVITTDFSDEEADGVAGRSTLRNPALDAEFSNIKTTLDGVLTSISALQRDDYKLQDLAVELHTLSAEVLALMGSGGFTINNPITWATGQNYAARSMIKNGTGTYVAVEAHTSAALFATDLAAGKWLLIFDTASYVAAGISFTPVGTVGAVNVQAAIAEVASEALQKSSNLSDLTNAAAARTNLSVFSQAEAQAFTGNVAVASGTADIIVAAFTPVVAAWPDGVPFIVECGAANATTTPTLNIGPGAKTIVRPDGSALLVGDIPGANFRAVFVYDLSLDRVLLLNPHHAGPTPGAAGTALVSNGLTAQPSFQSINAATVTNRAINGCFRIDQVREGATAYTINAPGPTQTVDQWSGFGIAAAGVFTVQREADPDYPGEYNLLLSCTTADAAIGAADLYGIHTDIEGYNVADWLIGTANAKQITVQFEVKANMVGTFGISITNSAVNRTYVGTFTINNINTVEQKSVTLNLDTTGTWLQTNGTGLRVRIALAAGSNFQGAAGAWSGSNLYTTASQSNFMSANTNVMRLKRFQVVQASSPIAFDRRSIQHEMLLAMRYYEKSYAEGTVPGAVVYAGCYVAAVASGLINSAYINCPFRVTKRAVPSITAYNPNTGGVGQMVDGGGTASGVTAAVTGTNGVAVYNSGSALAANTAGYVHITANARLS